MHSSWYFKKGRPTWWHLLYYVSLLLSMFRMLIHPSSGACHCLVRWCVGWLEACWCYVAGFLLVMWYLSALGYYITNRQSRYITPTRLKSAQYSLHNNATSICKLLKMDVLTSETCWAVNWHNKASVVKLVYLFSNMNSLLKELYCISEAPLDVLKFVLWYIIGDLNFPVEQWFCLC